MKVTRARPCGHGLADPIEHGLLAVADLLRTEAQEAPSVAASAAACALAINQAPKAVASSGGASGHEGHARSAGWVVDGPSFRGPRSATAVTGVTAHW